MIKRDLGRQPLKSLSCLGGLPALPEVVVDDQNTNAKPKPNSCLGYIAAVNSP
jgi:hypothetical protein